MSVSERENIHTLFLGKNYLELYKTQSKVLQAMLFVETQKEFEDFLKNEKRLEEDIFWLYYETVQGESLLIGGYEEDVTSKVTTFMKKKLPETAFTAIQEYLQDIYADIDDMDNLQEKMDILNQHLSEYGYHVQIESEDTYCALAYFLMLKQK